MTNHLELVDPMAEELANENSLLFPLSSTKTKETHPLFAEYIRSLAERPPPERTPTGIPTFDANMRGGIFAPRIIVLAGLPGAGKSSLAADIAAGQAEKGTPCIWLALDEGIDGLVSRFAARENISVQAMDRGDPNALRALAGCLEQLPFRVLDPAFAPVSIAAAIAEVDTIREPGSPAVLVVDSIQQCAALYGDPTASERAKVNVCLSDLKHAARAHHLIVLAISEVSRGAYASQDSSQHTSDMAAFKESGAIEYAAETAIVLRPVKGEEHLIDVRFPKNRALGKRAFRLRLDPITMRYAEVEPEKDEFAGSDSLARVKSRILNILAQSARPGGPQITSMNASYARCTGWGANKTQHNQAFKELQDANLIAQLDGAWRLRSEIER